MFEKDVHSELRERCVDRQPILRKARVSDVGAMHRIISHYAEQHLMLPKTPLGLYETLRDYTVVSDGSEANGVLGCGALHIYWEDLAEIRALAVAPDSTKKGVGTLLVNKLLEEAKELGLYQIFAFTYVPEFFCRFGFKRTENHALPLKVFNECFSCPKFNNCDEIAMVLHL